MKSCVLGLIGIIIFVGGCAASKKSVTVEAVFGPTNPTAEQKAESKVKRFGTVIELNPEKEKQYRQLHADVWPEVLAAVKKANIQNYSIFIAEFDGRKYLFSYLEYAGDNIEKDFAGLGDNPIVRDKWWPLTDSCQKRLDGTPQGEQWMPIEMIMHIP